MRWCAGYGYSNPDVNTDLGRTRLTRQIGFHTVGVPLCLSSHPALHLKHLNTCLDSWTSEKPALLLKTLRLQEARNDQGQLLSLLSSPLAWELQDCCLLSGPMRLACMNSICWPPGLPVLTGFGQRDPCSKEENKVW